ncbi:MAG: cytochrome P450 [Aeromicrobium sp.]
MAAFAPAAIDEILRMHGPLISSRRKVTRTVEFGGRTVPAGERISLIWASANRDEAVFGDPDEFRLDREPSGNLLFGAGLHGCPGAPWPGSSYVFFWKNSSSAPISSTWCPGPNRSGRPTRRVDSTLYRCGFGDPRPRTRPPDQC